MLTLNQYLYPSYCDPLSNVTFLSNSEWRSQYTGLTVPYTICKALSAHCTTCTRTLDINSYLLWRCVRRMTGTLKTIHPKCLGNNPELFWLVYLPWVYKNIVYKYSISILNNNNCKVIIPVAVVLSFCDVANVLLLWCFCF